MRNNPQLMTKNFTEQINQKNKSNLTKEKMIVSDSGDEFHHTPSVMNTSSEFIEDS